MATTLRSLLPQNNHSLTGTVLRGGAWVAAGNLFTRFSGAIRVIILARLLQPYDMGVVGFATSVYVWLEQLGQTGLQTTLVRKQGDIAPHLSTAWTINLTRAVAATIVMFLTAPLVARFMTTPELTNLLRVSSFGFLVRGLQSPALVYARREMNFRGEVRMMANGTLVGLIVLVPLAIHLRNAWAVVIATLCTQIVQTILSYRLQPFWPRLEYKKELARELYGFSRWIMWNNIAVFPIRYLIGPMIGKVLGFSSLGFYNAASQLAFLPTSQIGFALSGLLLPAFAKIESPSGLRHNFLRVISLLGAIVIPGAFCVSVFGQLLLRICLGEKWVASAPVAQVLVWAGAASAVAEITAQVVIRQGHPKQIAVLNAVKTLFVFATFYPALMTWGNTGMAVVLLTTATVGLLVQMIFIRRMLEIRWKDLIASQRFGAALAVPFAVAYLAMLPLNATYGIQAAVALSALTCCLVIIFVLRHRLISVITTGRG